jgi:DNA polymerase-4
VGKTVPTVSVEHVFEIDTNTAACVESALYRVVEKAGIDLRKQGLAARRVRIVIDYSDGKRMVRQAPVDPATANDFWLFAAAKTPLEKAWKRRVRVRRLGLVCDCLAAPPAQMALFGGHEQEKQKSDRLISALDAIRNRFGSGAIRMGKTVNLM